jgi:hypothetical protein
MLRRYRAQSSAANCKSNVEARVGLVQGHRLPAPPEAKGSISVPQHGSARMLVAKQSLFTSEKLCDGRITLCHGNCIDVMRFMAIDSIDSMVTAPPPLASELYWTAGLRLLRPGGHLAAVCPPLNYPRMACAVENAGFEFREMTFAVNVKDIHELAGGAHFIPSHHVVLARKPSIHTKPDDGYPGEGGRTVRFSTIVTMRMIISASV